MWHANCQRDSPECDSPTQDPLAYLEAPDALLHCAMGINLKGVLSYVSAAARNSR